MRPPASSARSRSRCLRFSDAVWFGDAVWSGDLDGDLDGMPRSRCDDICHSVFGDILDDE